MGKLADLVRKEFGVDTTVNINPLVSALAVTPLRVLGNNPDRLGWYVINLSAILCYLSFRNTVSSTSGIYLDSAGGVVGMTYKEDFEPTGYEIFGVGASGTPEIYVVEIVAIK